MFNVVIEEEPMSKTCVDTISRVFRNAVFHKEIVKNLFEMKKLLKNREKRAVICS